MSGRRALYRPAVKKRRFRHDSTTAVDAFSGFGGLTEAIRRAGFDVIMAANHNPYKVEIHEANHPYADHWIADLANPDSPDYHSARDLPPADLFTAGVSCVNHSLSNSLRAYQHDLTLFDLDDPDYEDRVTRSERDRATANCVLHYAATHHPRLILVECTTQLQSWGNLVPGSRKVGDGSTYRWWLNQFDILGYKHRVIFLNSMFFGVGQSRDRGYWIFWDKAIPAPDLDHRPATWCDRCDTTVEAVQTWRTGIPPTGTVCYGKQYDYRCPSCRTVIVPPFTPSLDALDLTNLGTRIGDKPLKEYVDKKTGQTLMLPMAPTTMARAEKARSRFAEFPAVLMPAKAVRGTEKHPWQAMATQTSQQETAILSTGAIMQMANSFEHPGSECRTRDLAQPLWTQPASNSTAILTPPVAVTGQVMAAHRHNGDGKHLSLPMDTVTATHEKAVLLAVDNFQGAPRSAAEPLPTQGGSETMALLSAGVVPFRQHTTPTSHAEPMPTMTAEQIPGLMFTGWHQPTVTVGAAATIAAAWAARLAELAIEDCYFRMMSAHEIGRGSGFDVDWNGRKGSFIVWGSARNQVDGYGNAVTPAVGEWISSRLRAVLHQEAVA